MTETFNPVYNQVQQVKDCVSYMLGEPIVEARIAIVIGHNGRNFVSSTDWRLTTQSGNKRILPFAMRPQYPNFVECVAGVAYGVQNEQFYIQPDKLMFAKSAEVYINGQAYNFNPREALKIYVSPKSTFIATDCLVECVETKEKRIYHILTDDNTLFGQLDEKGKISQVL
ncbi:MAG: hypothetical protein IJ660_07465 [Alphaproteobacteria bacterium]|nr:hypothetical protein [Alphaproteobacteria bacterium]